MVAAGKGQGPPPPTGKACVGNCKTRPGPKKFSHSRSSRLPMCAITRSPTFGRQPFSHAPVYVCPPNILTCVYAENGKPRNPDSRNVDGFSLQSKTILLDVTPRNGKRRHGGVETVQNKRSPHNICSAASPFHSQRAHRRALSQTTPIASSRHTLALLPLPVPGSKASVAIG